MSLIFWLYSKVRCLVLGHDYYILQEFSDNSRRIKCSKCNMDSGMCDSARSVIDWDKDLEDMYRSFGYTIIEPKFSDGSPKDFNKSQNSGITNIE